MNHKHKGLLINVIAYAIAFVLGAICWYQVKGVLLSSLVFTLVATFVVYLVSLYYKDTSLYDPYWSVEPPVLLLLNMIGYEFWNINSILLLIVFSIWATRLTINWYVTYKGVGFEDWRYHDFRESLHPILFHLLNVVGFQYVPTIVVYLGMIPALFLMQDTTFHPLTILGYFIMLVGVAFEHLADTTVHKFIRKKKNRGKTCNVGIWKYSRHPNYLGELTFWFGLLVVYFLALPAAWYYGFGSIGIDCVFIFASIPLMEKHNLKRRMDYPEYQEKTSVLFLLPQKSL